MTLVPIRSEGSHPPLFVLPQLFADGRLAWDIADRLGPDYPVYTFEWLKRGDEYLSDLDLKARLHAETLEQAGFEGPFLLTGHSYGAQLAYTLANRLLDKGREIGLLALIDDNSDVDRRRFNIENKTGDFSLSEVAGRFAIDRVRREKFPGKVMLFRAERWFGFRQADTACDWQYIAEGGVDVADFPATHTGIIEPPFIDQWVELLRSAIRGETPGTGLRHVPTQAHRVPDIALSAFVRNKFGDLDGEIGDYQLALEAQPDAPEWIRINLAQALEQAGKAEDAIAALQPVLDQARQLSNAHAAMARLLANHADKEQVSEFAQSIEALAAETPSDLQLRGVVFQICGLHDQSQDAYLKALEIDPSWSGCRVPCVRRAIDSRQFEQARQLIEEGLAITPGHRNLIELQADYHIANGNPRVAEQILTELVAENQTFWRGQATLINLVNRQGRHHEAVKLADAAYALQPPTIPPLVAIANAHLAVGHADFAGELFQKALDVDKGHLPAWIGLCKALEEMGRPAEALRVLQDLPTRLRERPIVKKRISEIAQRVSVEMP